LSKKWQLLIGFFYTLYYLTVISPVFADTTTKTKMACTGLRVSAVQIPHFSESEYKGAFIDLIRQAAKHANLPIEVDVYPKRRAVKVFLNKAANVYLPRASGGKELPAYKSTPIFVRRDFAFVRKGTEVPKSIGALEGMQVGLTRNYIYPKSLLENQAIDFVYAPTDVANIKMLEKGRFKISIIEEVSGLGAVEAAAAKGIVYDKSHPIHEMSVWMLFEKSECGLKYSKKINAAFEVMKSDGSWAAILSKKK